MQVEHELSVPAVSVMMMSCAAFAVAAMSGARLGQRLTIQRQSQLDGTAAVGALVPAIAVRPATWAETLLGAAGCEQVCVCVCAAGGCGLSARHGLHLHGSPGQRSLSAFGTSVQHCLIQIGSRLVQVGGAMQYVHAGVEP